MAEEPRAPPSDDAGKKPEEGKKENEVAAPVARIDGAEISMQEVEEFERAVAIFNRMRQVAIGLTAEQDWMAQGEVPYLLQSGVKKLGAIGISILKPELVSEHRQKHGRDGIDFMATITAKWRNREHTEVGTASTHDDFYCKRKIDKPKEDGPEHRFLPLDDVDVNSVKKHAVTNATSRAVLAILGMTGLTFDDLEAAGMKISNIKAVAYGGKSGKKGKTGAGTMTKEKEELRQKLADLARARGLDDMKSIFVSYIDFEGRKGKMPEKVVDLSDKWAASTLRKVDADWKSECDNGGLN